MRFHSFRHTVVLSVAVFLLNGNVHGQEAPITEKLQNRLRESVINLAISPDPSFTARLSSDTHTIWRVYASRNFTPMWFDSYGPKKALAVFRNAIGTAQLEGLAPSDYYSDDLEQLLVDCISDWMVHGNPDYAMLSRVDILMTDRFLRYISHLTDGRTRPKTTDPEWHVEGGPLSEYALLSLLSEGEPLIRIFDLLRPRHTLFRTLRVGLQQYHRIKAQGGWPAIPQGPLLGPGDRGARVRVLRNRLIRSQDLLAAEPDALDLFDGTLEAAVRHFQLRHGLDPDGLVGGDTLAALNVPVEVRINQILLNLERLRWLPNGLGERYLFVNITEYRLHIVEADRIVETLDVIVGRRDRPTPSISGQMRYMMLNPYWFIPLRIAKEDILPKIQQNPDYLTRQNIRVFRDWSPDAPEIEPSSIEWANVTSDNFGFKLRQDPADTNALGKAKFVFPNKFEIFIHDTPARVLFQNSRRDLSSGCIRIDRPLKLAKALIDGNPHWTPDALADALRKPQQTAVMLSDPIPVYILYLTAWAAEDGAVHFRDDIYSRDQHLYTAVASVASDPPPLWANRSLSEQGISIQGIASHTTAVFGMARMGGTPGPMADSGHSVHNGVATGLRIFDRRIIQPQRVGREPEHPAGMDLATGRLDA